jgi:MFS family permease
LRRCAPPACSWCDLSTTAPLAPLRERNYRWFFLSRLVNLVGSLMAPIALAFAVLEIDDSASALGQVLAAHSIPMVVFLLLGGVVADRFDRALVIQVSNVLSALSQGAIAWLVLTGHAQVWHLIVLSALNGVVSAISFPALSALVPSLVPRSQLQQANVLLSMARGLLAVLGPSVAGLLVATVGPGWAVAVDAATWLGAAALLVPVRIPPRAEPTDAQQSTLTDLRAGWTLFRTTTWLWVVVVAFGLLNAIHSGGWFTLGPALAKQTIGARGWGYVLSAESVGLLLMTVLLLRVRFRYPLRAGMLGCLAMALPLVVLGARPEVVPLVIAAGLAGAGVEVFNLGWNLAMQENIPEDMLSRAYSYDALGSFVAMPIGQLVYGPLGDAFGYQRVLVVSGVAYAVIVLLTLSSRSVRNLRRLPIGEPAPGSP